MEDYILSLNEQGSLILKRLCKVIAGEDKEKKQKKKWKKKNT